MEDKKIPLICVVGPTASGKSALAIELAKRFDGEVISVDSMQIYKGMNIGTAKVTPEEMGGITHHLLSFVDPGETFSVVSYVECADRAAEDIFTRGKIPVIAGGTGLYFHSFVDHIRFAQCEDNGKIRERLQKELRELGPEELHNRLSQIDPETAGALHPNNTGRVLRALEIYEQTGLTMSFHKELSRIEPSPYRPCIIGLTFKDRDTLYRRIDSRVDEMFGKGLAEEVGDLLSRGYSITSLNAIGYKEVVDHLSGKLTLDECIELVKRQTRRYAKRQLTWFRRDDRIGWLCVDEQGAEEILKASEEIIHQTLDI